MKKLLPLAAVSVIGLMVLVAAFAFFGGAEQPDEKTTDMIAGQKTDAGDIFVWNDAEYLYVKYEAGDGWAITETHLHVATSVKSFPVAGKTGNPVPGKFDYKKEHDPAVTEYEYKIKLPKGDTLYIAAHAVVVEIVECEDCDCDDCFVDLEGFADSLPETATISVTYGWETMDPKSYFNPVEVSGETNIDGDYDGWCIDIGRGSASFISEDKSYSSEVYSSYGELPDDFVLDKPENLPMINWLLNQDLIGQDSEEYEGSYTWGDIQYAIWKLIDDDAPSLPDLLKPYDMNRIDELVEMAEEHDDFQPGCGDKIGVIFAPVDSTGKVNAQVVLVMMDLPCYCYGDDETAWGKGERFTKKGNWGMYFTYEVTDD